MSKRKRNVDACKVCGSTDMNLVDGYYYCVECGTQDENVRQTVIEEIVLADGTRSFKRKKKFTTIVEEKNELCGEWHKWHAYNFIIVGLVDELIAAGARDTFKMKALWLWAEYIKKFQNKEELGLPKDNHDSSVNTEIKEESNEEIFKKKKKENLPKMTKDVDVLRKSTLLSLLYVALNLDGSDIQMSDLIRFTREGRLDISNCSKYVPKEIKIYLIPGWKTFQRRFGAFFEDTLLTSISFLKCFSIAPRLPDLKKIVDKFIKELCLPNDFKNLVLSLMQLVPCDYLEIDEKEIKTMVRFPAYECVVMSYVLVAFKMCFGLDDDYEISLSDVVDKINNDNCYLKSYKLGSCTMPTDRLFSFREWCNFIKFRKIMLSKYNLHMAEQHLNDIDDYAYIEQTHNKKSAQPKKYTDEIIMKLLDKLAVINEVEVVPKSEFKSTTTPMTTYTELIIEYIKDPDMRLFFSEDFTQYSLKYAVENLQLNVTHERRNILLGVSDSKKSINSEIYGITQITNTNINMVYVRNCENKNWLITNQPKAEHIKNMTKSKDDDKDSDHGYDSPTKSISSNKEHHCTEVSDVVKDTIEIEEELESIVEESTDTNIFDDYFDDIKEEIEVKEDIFDVDVSKVKQEDEEVDMNKTNSFNCSEIQNVNVTDEDLCSQNSKDSHSDLFFNPDTSDRYEVIRKLVLECCKKYKIRIPKEYDTKEPKKRKSTLKDKTDERSAKKRRLSNSKKISKSKISTARDEVNELIEAYYQNIKHDILLQISDQVKAAITNNDTLRPQNITEPPEDGHSAMPNDIFIDNVDINETRGSVADNETLGQSSHIEFIDENDLDEDENSGDPKFYEKEYDIEQLYLNIDGGNDSDDPFDVTDDPVICEILNRKIKEIENTDIIDTIIEEKEESEEQLKLTRQEKSTVPLNVIRQEKLMLNNNKKMFESTELEPLVKNHTQIKEFKYWIRNYASHRLTKTHDINEKFHKELDKNFPKSFYFVIRECATMLEITPYQLYKAMVNLENRLMAY